MTCPRVGGGHPEFLQVRGSSSVGRCRRQSPLASTVASAALAMERRLKTSRKRPRWPRRFTWRNVQNKRLPKRLPATGGRPSMLYYLGWGALVSICFNIFQFELSPLPRMPVTTRDVFLSLRIHVYEISTVHPWKVGLENTENWSSNHHCFKGFCCETLGVGNLIGSTFWILVAMDWGHCGCYVFVGTII